MSTVTVHLTEAQAYYLSHLLVDVGASLRSSAPDTALNRGCYRAVVTALVAAADARTPPGAPA